MIAWNPYTFLASSTRSRYGSRGISGIFLESLTVAVLALFLPVLVVAAQDGKNEWIETTERPSALHKMVESRQRIQRAEIHWSKRFPRDPDTHGDPLGYVSRVSPTETAILVRGTPEGIAAWNEHGDPIPYSRRSYLKRTDDHWELEVDGVYGHVRQGAQGRSQPMTDARTIALLPVMSPMRTVPEVIWDWPEDDYSERRYREAISGGLHIVEMRLPDREIEIRWEIDPKIDWNPVRSQLRYRGRVINESVVEYEEFDGVWFPRSAKYFDATGDLIAEILVESAQINTDDLPQILTPDHVGFKTGLSVSFVREDGSAEGMTYVAGGGLLPDREYSRLVGEGKIEDDPELVEMANALLERLRSQELEKKQANSGSASQPSVPDSESGGQRSVSETPSPTIVPNRVDDEWERYTHEFIARYKLNDDQSAAAMRVLHDCQEQRTSYLNRQQERIALLQERATGPKKVGDAERITRELDQLREPIQRIFEQQLKPRLDRLPTRAQRQAAESAAASQPTP